MKNLLLFHRSGSNMKASYHRKSDKKHGLLSDEELVFVHYTTWNKRME